MNALSCGEEIMTRRSAVLIPCQRVTDGRTDGRPDYITCFSIADARKNRENVKSRLDGFKNAIVAFAIQVIIHAVQTTAAVLTSALSHLVEKPTAVPVLRTCRC